MKKKILIVDDDESILDSIALILEEAEYTIQTVVKGEEVYEIVESFKPDLILLDVLISGADGRHICKNLKKNSRHKSIPIVMISAHPSAEKTVKECGAEDFLAKPFEVSDLLAIITKNLS